MPNSLSNEVRALTLSDVIRSNWYPVRAYQVIDGDTLKLELDLGFNVRFAGKARLAYVDAPELDEEDGKRATAAVQKWLVAAEREGLVIAGSVEKPDKYGRLLVVIRCTSKAQSLNDYLLEQGLAKRVRSRRRNS